jgi:hypothetical protein
MVGNYGTVQEVSSLVDRRKYVAFVCVLACKILFVETKKELESTLAAGLDAFNASGPSLLDIRRQGSPDVSCRVEMKKSNLVLESSTIGLGDEWIIYITVSRIQSNDALIARLVDQNTKEKTILYKPIDHEKCQPYDEDGAALLLFAEDFNYFRTCSPNCTLAQRTALPQVSLELLRAGSGAAVLSHIESCLDEGIPGDPPAAAYSPFSLAILSPPAGAVLGGGPVDVRYVVRRADSISRCATAMVAARLGGRAHTEVRMVRGACDAESLVRLDAIPRGTHLLELEALDAVGRPLAAARVYFAHPGPGLREIPVDFLCQGWPRRETRILATRCRRTSSGYLTEQENSRNIGHLTLSLLECWPLVFDSRIFFIVLNFAFFFFAF